MKPKQCALIGLAAGLFASCAPAGYGWINPGVTQAQQRQDYLACRNWADRQVLDGALRQFGSLDDEFFSPMELATEQENARRTENLVAACMQGRGYVPADKDLSTPAELTE